MPAASERRQETPSKTRWLEPDVSVAPTSLAEATRTGLSANPKELSSRFFYDAKGSSLFEEICGLPEYYLTRAEAEILERDADDLATRLPQIDAIVELGSGSSVKTEQILMAFQAERSLRYAPIDVSRSALEESVARLEERHADLEIWATVAEYESGLAAIEAHDLGAKLFLWLGSSIGNLRRAACVAFLARRRAAMSPDDRMLIGIDLRKDRATLENAYDDRQGITGRFNMNLLTRINTELNADFDPDQFVHRVHYERTSGSVQSFLESQSEQSVRIEELDLDVHFAKGETIHTEDSFKYSFDEIDELAAASGFTLEHQALDSAERFSLNLFAPV